VARRAVVSEPADTQAEARRITTYYSTRVERPMSPTVHFVLTERRTALVEIVERFVDRPLGSLRICDVGCGDGGDLQFWEQRGARAENMSGTELLSAPLATARSRLPGADLHFVDGFELPFDDNAFDLVYGSMVLSSILDTRVRRALFAEMERVAVPDGIIAIYDFRVRKPGNRQVVAMNRSRIRELGRKPNVMRPLTPLLPLLPTLMRMPRMLREPLIALLPRTHGLWVWRMSTVEPPYGGA
jgi:ubiquinone/menaquinone biosynthesis C-methylase UbiE